MEFPKFIKSPLNGSVFKILNREQYIFVLNMKGKKQIQLVYSDALSIDQIEKYKDCTEAEFYSEYDQAMNSIMWLNNAFK